MKKIQNLKLLWKKLCDAKQKKESSLNTIIAPYWHEEKEKQSCLRQKNVGTDREPLIVLYKCDDFNLHANCKNTQCSKDKILSTIIKIDLISGLILFTSLKWFIS